MIEGIEHHEYPEGLHHVHAGAIVTCVRNQNDAAAVAWADQYVMYARIVEALSGYRFSGPDEDALQRGVAEVLGREGFAFEREVCLNAHDRLDFLVERVAIECKISGSLSMVTRQVHRYVQSPLVEALVLVTTRTRHQSLSNRINNKPVRVVWTMGGVR